MRGSRSGSVVFSEGEILAFLKRLAAEELELTPEQISRFHLDTPIVEGLQLDSVALVALITAVEEEYDFVFDTENPEQIETIRDLVRLIQMQTKNKEPNP